MSLTPQQIEEYVSRKAAEFMVTLGADTEHEWVGPGGNIDAGVRDLIESVMRDMTIHLSHTTQEARERWAAGS